MKLFPTLTTDLHLFLSQIRFGDDDDIFSRHTPEQTAFTLDVKGTLLLQKVARYVRRAEMRGDGDPRATESFRALDKLITSYRSVLSIYFPHSKMLGPDSLVLPTAPPSPKNSEILFAA